MGAMEEKAGEAIRVQKKEEKCVRNFQAHKGREPRLKGIALPYNKAFDLSARGWHAARLRERRASSPPRAGLPASRSGPCSQFIRALYGRGNG